MIYHFDSPGDKFKSMSCTLHNALSKSVQLFSGLVAVTPGVTPGVTHVGAYHSPSDWFLCYISKQHSEELSQWPKETQRIFQVAEAGGPAVESKDFLMGTNVIRKEVKESIESQFSTSVGGARCFDRERQLEDPWIRKRDLPRSRPRWESDVGAGQSWLIYQSHQISSCLDSKVGFAWPALACTFVLLFVVLIFLREDLLKKIMFSFGHCLYCPIFLALFSPCICP